MAETFVTVYQGAGGRIDLGYDYTQNIENNSTTLTVKAYVVKTNSSYYSYRQAAINFRLTVNGVDTNHSWTFDFRNQNLNQRYLITTATRTFTHATDGTKGNVPASVYCATGTSGLGTISGSTTIGIATIPRASQPSLDDTTVYMRDQTVRINTNRASSVFTHTLTYSFGSASGTIATGVGTYHDWVPPISLASQIPNATNGLGTITCKTYNGSTLIGTKTVSIRLYVPADIKPSVSIGKSGVDLYQSQYVQGKSKVTVTLTASGTYGSTIKSRSTTVKSGTNTISSSTSTSFTSGVINYSGTITIATTVTDSRGRTASSSTTISVVAYTGPQVTAFKAFRANSGGSANPQGAYIRITGSASISSINSTNSKTTILRYRAKGASTWINATSNTSSYTPSLAATVAADENTSYEVQIYTEDYYSSSYQTSDVGTAFVLMDFNASGKGIAIGKVSENDSLEVALPIDYLGYEMVPRPRHFLSVPAAGWYRLAWVEGSGRGSIKIMIFATGGSYAPRLAEIHGFHDWGSTGYFPLLYKAGNTIITTVRWTNDGANTYLEAYFPVEIGFQGVMLDAGYNTYTMYSGELPAGGGTAQQSAILGSIYSTSNTIVDSNGFIKAV